MDLVEQAHSRITENVQALRHAHGMSQAAVARAIGIGPPEFTDRVKGRTFWSVGDLAKIAALFRLDSYKLLARLDVQSLAATGTDGQRVVQAVIVSEDTPEPRLATVRDTSG